MSQLNLTTEEDQLVLSGLRAKATQYAAMFGSEDQAILDLIAKVESQLITPVVESAPVATPVVEPEVVVEAPVAEVKEDEQE
jgi:hypothetical protein